MDKTLFSHYAIALLDLAIVKDVVDSTKDEIVSLRDLFKNHKEFIKVLSLKNHSKNEFYLMIDRIFSSYSQNVRAYLKVIIKNNLSFYLYDILNSTVYYFEDFLKIEEGFIYFSKVTSQPQIDLIIQSIERKIGKRVKLNVEIDPKLLGGFKVVLRNHVFDASLIRRLNKIKEEIMKE